MPGPVFWNDKILFTAVGVLAMDPNCCCDFPQSCCCDLFGETLIGTVSSGDCSLVDGLTFSFFHAINCAEMSDQSDILDPCETAQFSMTLRLRCNPTLSDRGGGACDKYEMQVVYNSSSCTTTPTWYRVESGCTCDPLMMVFKVAPPSWNGQGSPDCNCCSGAGLVTVTVTL